MLETIVRQKETWQKDATRLFGSLNTPQAIELYQDKGSFKTIEESGVKNKDAIEAFCLARQMSGRIWMEMQGEIHSQKLEIEHPDVSLHLEWKQIRQDAVKQIVQNLDQYSDKLTNRGIDLAHLNKLGKDYQSATQLFQQKEILKRIEDMLQPMSYENLIDTRKDTKNALIDAWTQNRSTTPTQTHIILAFTNKDVSNLNEQARQVMRNQGEIKGKDFTYKTCHLEINDFGKETRSYTNKAFACGDRLLFTRNDNGLDVKNGTLGTIVKLDQNKISVRTDDSKKVVSFSPKLYPFIDNGWATTIHKSQGVSVDHVKLLASYEQYRNLTYVGMSRHRHTLEVFGSSLDFWHPEKYVDRLSRIQEKLSGVDYLDAKEIHAQLKADEKVLWATQKIQQGQDLWNAVKATVNDVLAHMLYDPKDIEIAKEPYRTFDHSEEKRSSDLFTILENISNERLKFEQENQEKYQAVCELFHFKERYGREPKNTDKQVINEMTEKLTKIAGQLFETQAVKEHTLPTSSEISIKAYEEYSSQLRQEKESITPEMKEKEQQERQTQEQQAQIQREQTLQRGMGRGI